MDGCAISIPKSAGAVYVKRAKECQDENGLHNECLAYFIGFEEDNQRTVTEVLFPRQHGNAAKVDDLGKIKS